MLSHVRHLQLTGSELQLIRTCLQTRYPFFPMNTVSSEKAGNSERHRKNLLLETGKKSSTFSHCISIICRIVCNQKIQGSPSNYQ